MVTTRSAKSKLIGQGADPAALTDCIKTLQTSGMLPPHDSIALSARELVSLLIGSTAPEPKMATAHVIDYADMPGDFGTFGEALKAVLNIERPNGCVTAVRVCQSFRFARIEFADCVVYEFNASEFKGRCILLEAVLSGGIICDLAHGLKSSLGEVNSNHMGE